ncbi:uncharacterized protein At5g08430-like isoform X2 [Prosopis cineraria]|uniref:uncharacterized protein At5g08430-like isoform X2 n=1 Tax=Prosopis cineraria TaxID=364024 RepID=UPI00240FA653|nr:uncharacterized protein At5g08430-like isoform X2 [Prosopis cineraria]
MNQKIGVLNARMVEIFLFVIMSRHYCFHCQNPARFYCLGCPRAVCNKCYAVSEFATFGGGKVLCSECLELVFIIEKNLDRDSEGNKISLVDRETYEALFKEYWEIIKVKEGLTSDDVCDALTNYKMDQNSVHHSETEEEGEGEDEDEEEGWIPYDRDNGKLGAKRNKSKLKEFIGWESKSPQTKYKKDKNSLHQRRFGDSEEDLTSYSSDVDHTWKHKAGTKRKGSESQKFIGWGSKSVIDFLASIGKDIIKPFTRWEVTYLIHEYVSVKDLGHPKFKEKFIPDEKLIPLLGKKVVSVSKIYSLLKPHFVENSQQITEEENDDENKDNFSYKLLSGLPCFENNLSSLLRKSLLKKGDYITRTSCFASINAENIKLIYLKQSLVLELSKQPESFKDKVIGTFVKIRADPTDHRQGNHYHLARVLGVNNEFLLQVSFMPKAIAISELSDDDFTEQECETLQQKVKDNLLPKMTVKELEAKARYLHEDITKHWIAVRLVYLEKRIEYANDKGRQREKDALIDEKLDLERPLRRDELLRQVPVVSPELIQEKYDPDDTREPDEQGL